MKLYKALFIPTLLLSGVFSTWAGEAENNITQDYMVHWNEAMDGQTNSISQAAILDADIVKSCKTVAPKTYRSAMVNLWQHKTGTKMTETAFLSEDLQLFDRLATISCIEGASYEHKGNGELLVKTLSTQLLDMDVKDGNDAFEQIKTMEFQTGIVTARYGVSIEKKRQNRAN